MTLSMINQIAMYQVDAFAESTFEGNPAAVCVLDDWLDDVIMQAIASEMNLSETAFLVKEDPYYRIRWFTPEDEVDLCGHATLASAHVLYEHLDHAAEPIQFISRSGRLAANKIDNSICLDFPAQNSTETALLQEWADILGGSPLKAYLGVDLIICYSDASEIEILSPDFSRLAKLPGRGICVTAPGNGNGFDFVSRYFAPKLGIPEDPVTGSVHTQLAPLYHQNTGKTSFIARQASKRSGVLQLVLDNDRVYITGKAITAMIGTFYLSPYSPA